MLEKVINGCKFAANSVSSAVMGACHKVQEAGCFLGRKVSQLTEEHIAKPSREFLKEAGPSMPYTAVLTPFAVLGVGPLAGAVALIAVRVLENKSNHDVAERAYIGIRNFCIIGAAIDSAKSLITLNPFYLINLPFYLLIGALSNEYASRAHTQTA